MAKNLVFGNYKHANEEKNNECICEHIQLDGLNAIICEILSSKKFREKLWENLQKRAKNDYTLKSNIEKKFNLNTEKYNEKKHLTMEELTFLIEQMDLTWFIAQKKEFGGTKAYPIKRSKFDSASKKVKTGPCTWLKHDSFYMNGIKKEKVYERNIFLTIVTVIHEFAHAAPRVLSYSYDTPNFQENGYQLESEFLLNFIASRLTNANEDTERIILIPLEDAFKVSTSKRKWDRQLDMLSKAKYKEKKRKETIQWMEECHVSQLVDTSGWSDEKWKEELQKRKKEFDNKFLSDEMENYVEKTYGRQTMEETEEFIGSLDLFLHPISATLSFFFFFDDLEHGGIVKYELICQSI